jgi:hypothetical protein
MKGILHWEFTGVVVLSTSEQLELALMCAHAHMYTHTDT